MFCPKCGNPLVLKHYANEREELFCVKGEMGLSQVMRQTFEERYQQHASSQSPNPPFHPQFHSGFHWFCPGDGEQLNAHLECPACGKHLRDQVFQLVEKHPHLE
jgi:ssDNA-binding Zn-finger/Zn-ribbon topoisomerase 1